MIATMKQLKYITIAVIAILGLNACEDFLSLDNPNSPNSETFWTDLSRTDLTLTSAYSV